MPMLNFQPGFSSAIQWGCKRQTIRPVRAKNPIKPGDTLHLYTGARTKKAMKIDERRCLSVTPVTICQHSGINLGGVIYNVRTDGPMVDAFCRADGFVDWDDLLAWFWYNYSEFKKGRTFNSVVISW